VFTLCTKATHRSSQIRKTTRELLRRYNWEVLDHPPYGPDLAPSDFHLFGPLKKHLDGRRFATDDEVQQAIMSWLQARDTDFF
jgi:hypothetical protein